MLGLQTVQARTHSLATQRWLRPRIPPLKSVSVGLQQWHDRAHVPQARTIRPRYRSVVPRCGTLQTFFGILVPTWLRSAVPRLRRQRSSPPAAAIGAAPTSSPPRPGTPRSPARGSRTPSSACPAPRRRCRSRPCGGGSRSPRGSTSRRSPRSRAPGRSPGRCSSATPGSPPCTATRSLPHPAPPRLQRAPRRAQHPLQGCHCYPRLRKGNRRDRQRREVGRHRPRRLRLQFRSCTCWHRALFAASTRGRRATRARETRGRHRC
mmetsp:Transcript_54317/g.152993  ORF Transcript_54317/g.152993 Transcript_54317/m.152993 type:complete len:264 (-) Transcript_54317:615-1406(-)